MTSTTERLSATRALATGPVRCASWCAQGDGHAHAKYLVDQACQSVSAEQSVVLHEPWVMGDGSEKPAEVTVVTRQEIGGEPHVVLVTPEDTEVRFTADEIEALLPTLQHFAWVSRQDARERNAFELGLDAAQVLGQTRAETP